MNIRNIWWRTGNRGVPKTLGFWSPTLIVKDPQIPHLPLESPSGGPTYYGILKRWTGAAWVKELLKVYLAGSWQTKPLKFWDGSQWRLVDTTGI
jgi:hypothetical protein